MNDKPMVYGVDVSKTMLVVGEYESGALRQIGNAPEPIAAWLASVPAGSLIATEATGVYHRLLAHLAHAAGMVVYVLNPQTLKHYARAIGQRGKTDGCDARMITRYVVHERAKLRCWQPPAAPADTLSRLLVRRRALVNARQMLCQSLSGMPALKGPRQTLRTSFKRMIGSVDLLIHTELARVPEIALHFTRADSFIAYTGLDPRPDDSGQHRGKRRLSKHGPALLRCLLYNAGMAASNSKLFKPLYTQLQARGLQSTEAIVILARKLARIAFALYKSGQTFDAQKYLKTT